MNTFSVARLEQSLTQLLIDRSETNDHFLDRFTNEP